MDIPTVVYFLCGEMVPLLETVTYAQLGEFSVLKVEESARIKKDPVAWSEMNRLSQEFDQRRFR